MVRKEVNARINEFVTRYPILQSAGATSGQWEDVIDFKKEKERFDYKNFSNCKPSEFEGETNPIISLRWLSEVEGAFLLHECPQRLKVIFTEHLLRKRGKDWWDLIVKARGYQEAAKIPWDSFKEMFLEKYAPYAEIAKIREKFLTINQGDMSVSDYTGLFVDKSRFYAEYVASPWMLRDHYLRHLRQEIREFIDPILHDTLDKMINKALSREMEIQRQETVAASKRKVEQPSSSHNPYKKQKFGGKHQQHQQPNEERREIPICNSRGRRHHGECRFGPGSCHKCGKPGHFARDCPSAYRMCFYCYGNDHLKSD